MEIHCFNWMNTNIINFLGPPIFKINNIILIFIRFHGKCINLREKMAKYIDQYFCDGCKKKDSSLETVYKEKYREKMMRRLNRKKEKFYGLFEIFVLYENC